MSTPIKLSMYCAFNNGTSPRPGVTVKTVRLVGSPPAEVSPENPKPVSPNAAFIKEGGNILVEFQNAGSPVSETIDASQEFDCYIVPKGSPVTFG